MEDNTNVFESLLERATDYGKTSIELLKLKALDKMSNVLSSVLAHSFVIVFLVFFILFISIGLSFWAGELLGKIYYGFFAVAAFYGIAIIVTNFFIHTCIKKSICNYIIKLVLK